jgi:hypothetical protein
VLGSCEHSNKLSSSIKDVGFIYYLSVQLASEVGLCSMEVVS